MTQLERVLTIIAVFALILWPTIGNTQFPLRDIMLNNETVRVAEVTLHPGTGSGRHMGIEPEIGIVVEGELVLDTPTGRRVLRRGSVYWLPGLTLHDVRNESSGRATLWDILLYRCQ